MEPKLDPQSVPNEDNKQFNNEELLNAVLSKSEDELIPWETTILPSKGLYYDGKIPDGKVEVKAWGIKADKILSTARLAQSGQSLDWIFRNYVRFPQPFDPMDLLVGDRTFLLYYLRGITHGNEYEFMVQCPDEECDGRWTETYDLNMLSKTIKGPNESIGKEPFTVILPFLSAKFKQDFWVKIKLLRGSDLHSMMSNRRVEKKLRPTAKNRDDQPRIKHQDVDLDRTIEQNMNLIIVEAMGDTSRGKISDLVSKLHATDTATIRQFLRDNSPGIDTSIEVKCPDCGKSIPIDLPITEGFFRPKK